MAQGSFPAVVAGTGFEGRERLIRRFCREMAPLELRREPNNRFDANAIGVWMRCSVFFGIFKDWRQIGYIPATKAKHLAPKLDRGAVSIDRAYVRSFYAPSDREHPRVSIVVEYSGSER